MSVKFVDVCCVCHNIASKNQTDIFIKIIDSTGLKHCFVDDSYRCSVLHHQDVCTTSEQFSKGVYTDIIGNKRLFMHDCIPDLATHLWSSYVMCFSCFFLKVLYKSSTSNNNNNNIKGTNPFGNNLTRRVEDVTKYDVVYSDASCETMMD